MEYFLVLTLVMICVNSGVVATVRLLKMSQELSITWNVSTFNPVFVGKITLLLQSHQRVHQPKLLRKSKWRSTNLPGNRRR